MAVVAAVRDFLQQLVEGGGVARHAAQAEHELVRLGRVLGHGHVLDAVDLRPQVYAALPVGAADAVAQ